MVSSALGLSMESLSENNASPTLWEACAGAITRLPPVGSIVYYFPEGHVEHVRTILKEPCALPRIPGPIACKVTERSYTANIQNDDVSVKVGLEPLSQVESILAAARTDCSAHVSLQDKKCLCKCVTTSDINGGVLMPMSQLQRVFPALDPQLQDQLIAMTDVHGKVWMFRYLVKDTPRRHSLTVGWFDLVKEKKLKAGDYIIIMRGEDENYCVGIRQDIERVQSVQREVTKSSIGSIVEAMNRAAAGRPFEVVYHPRAGTPVFFVIAAVVNTAMSKLALGRPIRYPMQIASGLSWLFGFVSGLMSYRGGWINAPWRSLVVEWEAHYLPRNSETIRVWKEEHDRAKEVSRVNPWEVEAVMNMEAVRLTHYSLPIAKNEVDTGLTELRMQSNPFMKNPEVDTELRLGLPSYGGPSKRSKMVHNGQPSAKSMFHFEMVIYWKSRMAMTESAHCEMQASPAADDNMDEHSKL